VVNECNRDFSPSTPKESRKNLFLMTFQYMIAFDDEQIECGELGFALGGNGPSCSVRCLATTYSFVDVFRCSASTLADGLHHFILQTSPLWSSALPPLFDICDVLVFGCNDTR
jgi:hypothetical protein